jgi:hypothetical protein
LVAPALVAETIFALASNCQGSAENGTHERGDRVATEESLGEFKTELNRAGQTHFVSPVGDVGTAQGLVLTLYEIDDMILKIMEIII